MSQPGHRSLARGTRIRVLIVDDSVVIRRLITHALEDDDAIQVVGSAANGVIALQRIPQLNPDVITLDIEMPEMDGLETLRQIRKLHPNLYVIMFSTLTERGAASTMDALALGADDYVTKAANAGSLDRSLSSLRSDLVPKIKQFFDLGLLDRAGEAAKIPSTIQSVISSKQGGISVLKRAHLAPKVLVVGVSTGGPSALAVLVPMFPKDFPLPILIVQHMPPLFTRLLAERLNAHSALRVGEAAEGSVVEAGQVLIAPGNYHLKLRRLGNQILAVLDQATPENSCRPSADVLFRAAADLYGGSVIAVVLTGMGQDGLRGSQMLHALGANVIVQDEPSSVVWGMPGAVARDGIADSIVDLHAIVPLILRQI